MTRSEFRWNKRRKHYAYLFKDVGQKRKNIVLSSKPTRKWKGKTKMNIKLYRHPNIKNKMDVYIIPVIYIDGIEVFGEKQLDWNFDVNDKRTIKRIKKKRKKSATKPSTLGQ